MSPSSRTPAQGKGEASSRVDRIRLSRRSTVSRRASATGDGEFRHLALDGVEPGSVVGRSSSRRLRERKARSIAFTRARGRHRPPAPAGRGSGAGRRPAAKQRVEIGGEPDHPHLLGKRRGGGCGGAVDAAEPAAALVAPPRRLPGGADAVVAVRAFERQRHTRSRRPRPRAPSRKVRPAQAPSGGEQRQGLQDVGLAGPFSPTSATKWRPTARSSRRGCGSRGRSDG